MKKENKSKGIIITSLLMIFPASMYFVTAHKAEQAINTTQSTDKISQLMVESTYDNLFDMVQEKLQQHRTLQSQAIKAISLGDGILITGEVENAQLKEKLSLLIAEIQENNPTTDITNDVQISKK